MTSFEISTVPFSLITYHYKSKVDNGSLLKTEKFAVKSITVP